MKRREESIPDSYFEELYAATEDPWNFATSRYERNKYNETLAALSRPSYDRGLEIGCSIGVLTASLALRCRHLLAIDIADRALAKARVRCRRLPHVFFRKMRVPSAWPAGNFDLMVLSEVIYYFDRNDVAWLADRVCNTITPGGHVALVHWTGATDYPLSGDEASEQFIQAVGNRAHLLLQHRTKKFRLESLAFDDGP
jgi:cyclopropane fatty-acyl-phospholipid synthase-like methyltransferase